MHFDVLFWLLAITAILVTGVSKSGFGGAIGAVAVPLMSLSISPVIAAAIMLPLLIVMDVLSVKAWWGKWHWQHLKILIPGSALGVIAGYLMFDYWNADLIRNGLGIMCLLFALNGLLLKELTLRKGLKAIGLCCSATAGLTSFVAHAGGPPLSIYLLSVGLSKQAFVATAAMFFAAVNLFKLISYIALDLLNLQFLLVSAMLLPVAYVGIRLGVWLQARINRDTFFKCVYVFLIVLGIRLIMA
ncbi:sulfite exporter TauE/SafE family protein [Aestuariibacter salexigens]|uniref:sulfite exporter TauE/SafE family protein n=1 Tax=Aestuariibacter salexigens TaxID=226010 RepID=UPI0003FAEED9|nr:sulfite exporter TauE/SafE family protein [Aestuariibacter salexigens]